MYPEELDFGRLLFKEIKGPVLLGGTEPRRGGYNELFDAI